MAAAREHDRFNGPVARGVAGLVLLAVVAILLYLHRYELLREGIDTEGLPPAVAACVEQRLSALDDQIARGVVTQEMAGPIRGSVVTFCQETAG